MVETQYQAGVCNIGKEEIGRRRNIGWVGLIVTIILFVILKWIGVNSWWQLLTFLPATMSASGFLQAYLHFCSGFASKGIFNFGTLGQTNKVTDEASRVRDKARGNQITLYAALIGIVVAILCVFI